MLLQTAKTLPLQNLTKYQIGTFGIYWLKMFFTGLGLDVVEAQGSGNSFFVRKTNAVYNVYVRTVRPKNKISYSFVTKETWQFKLPDNHLLALVFIEAGCEPVVYLIPALSWKNPTALLVDRDYNHEGQVSQPEWGISTNQKNMELLNEFELVKQLEQLGLCS